MSPHDFQSLSLLKQQKGKIENGRTTSTHSARSLFTFASLALLLDKTYINRSTIGDVHCIHTRDSVEIFWRIASGSVTKSILGGALA